MNLSTLSEEQLSMIRMLKDFTNTDKADEACASLLQFHEWNMEEAVNAALSGNWTDSGENALPQDISTGLRRRRREQENENEQITAQQVHQPEPENEDSNSSNSSEIKLSWVSECFTALFGNPTRGNPQNDAIEFIQRLKEQYGTTCPPLLDMGYQQASSRANSETKYLLVYLTSDLHEDTSIFNKNTICTERFKQWIEVECHNLLCWGGSIHNAEPAALGESLGCTGFPFLSLVTVQSNGVSIIERIQGFMEVENLIQRLNAAMERNHTNLESARRAREERIATSMLRQEQDREYQESLELDRKRKDEAEAKLKQKEEEEERLRKEEEQRKEEENRKNMMMQHQIGIKRELVEEANKRSDRNVQIKFHLHTGARIQCNFAQSDTLKMVRDFIDISLYDMNIPLVNYELATNYPKRVFTIDENSLTLEEANLCPRALVFVQDLDS